MHPISLEDFKKHQIKCTTNFTHYINKHYTLKVLYSHKKIKMPRSTANIHTNTKAQRSPATDSREHLQYINTIKAGALSLLKVECCL